MMAKLFHKISPKATPEWLIKVFGLSGINTIIKSTEKVLIFGADNFGTITYNTIRNNSNNSYEILGFITDNKTKIRKNTSPLNVYPLENVTSEFIDLLAIETIIISVENIKVSRLLQVFIVFFELGLKVKIVPPVQKWIDRGLSINHIKDVKIEDLLERDPIIINNPVLVDTYKNQIIFITGAAGSIGSEIARKTAKYAYKKLVLIDTSESALYDIQQEFIQNGIKDFIAIVADVRDHKRMEHLFSVYRPKIVFHAAAYKHVPLMENNPYEAVNVNIGGTRNVASLAVTYSVDTFVFISTDKAVNPTSVMGATKRIAELYINCLQGKGQTKFITTRFGNVIGSNGSVIPLFKKQIDAGGPLSVTHKDITRFFMTISEACQLVLEAATMGNGGEIFVFDMGESVKIFDLAKSMILISGLRYPEDINIKITGLRPGEKIHEELLADGESTKTTYHQKITIARTKRIDSTNIGEKITNLCTINSKINDLEVVSLIKDIIPEYISNNSKFEVLDSKKDTRKQIEL